MNNNNSYIFLFAVILLCSKNVLSQESPPNLQPLTSGISIAPGIGYFGIKDFYISKEKYSGFNKFLMLSWNKSHVKYHKRIFVDYKYSEKINNYNITSEVHQFYMNNIYLYHLGELQLLSKFLSFYIGPSTDVLVHFRKQKIASNGGSAFSNAYSPLVILSGGFNTDMIYPISNNFQLEFHNNFNTVSLGFKMIDLNDNNSSPVKFLTPFNGLHINSVLSLNYQFHEHLFIHTGYQSTITSVSAWDKYNAIGDYIFIKLSYSL